ncbi:hypothetical protein C1645_50215 [Glomus cerebriforme]|uniref:Uncharacterized protein n=1 Tax=Glomus cerebriforme TaxID=658196 RepID=A0A397S143_9GLOM|nr:hypothetical protein C1645_50215 [Glomus cerebriforme]
MAKNRFRLFSAEFASNKQILWLNSALVSLKFNIILLIAMKKSMMVPIFYILLFTKYWPFLVVK